MRIPARCNKRSCQARRNLSKYPGEYKHPPKCHFKNCDGLMYVDKDRLAKKENQRRPVCYDDCYPHPHRVDSPHCRKREEYVLSKAFSTSSKHSPFINVTSDDPGF